MEIKVDRKDLGEALKIAHLVTPTKSTTAPILTNVKLAAQNHVTVEASDLDNYISIRLPRADIETKGETVFLARKLAAGLNDFPYDTFSFQATATKARVSSGDFSLSLPTQKTDDFPLAAEIKPISSFKVRDFHALLKLVTFAASNDKTRYSLTGVYAEVKDGTLTLAATDSRRLARVKVPCKGENAAGIIRLDSANVLERVGFCGQVEMGEDRFRFTTLGEMQLTSRAVEGNFPQIASVYPKEVKHLVTIDRILLGKVLKRAIKNSDLDNTCTTHFTFSKGKLSLVCGFMPDGATVKDSMPIDFKGPGSFTIGLNIKYLLEGLERAPADKVTLKLVDHNAPAIIESGNWDYVLMPIRI